MKTDKKLADELDAADRLRARGYVWKKCSLCKGETHRGCSSCGTRGGYWQSPMPRISPNLTNQHPPAHSDNARFQAWFHRK